MCGEEAARDGTSGKEEERKTKEKMDGYGEGGHGNKGSKEGGCSSRKKRTERRTEKKTEKKRIC